MDFLTQSHHFSFQFTNKIKLSSHHLQRLSDEAHSCIIYSKIEMHFLRGSSWGVQPSGRQNQRGDGYKPNKVTRKRAVIFAVLNYSEKTNSIFKSMNLPSTTNTLYIGPSNLELDENCESVTTMRTLSFDTKTEEIKSTLTRYLSLSMRKVAERSNSRKSTYVLIIILCLHYSSFRWLYIFDSCKAIFLSPILWLAESFAVNIICIGEIVYNIIHGTPFSKFDREGSLIELIHSEQSHRMSEKDYLCFLFLSSREH